MTSPPSRLNNFDLLRLLAAVQVSFLHSVHHLKIEIPDRVLRIVELFPGVSIFFTISGYLIYKSLIRSNGDIAQYALNRSIRIFPALFAAWALSLTLILITTNDIPALDLGLWSAGQISLFQYWTPNSLREYGVGTPNGALWTIPVELEFYALLPIIALMLARSRVWTLLLLFVASAASHMPITRLLSPEQVAYKLFFVSIIPHLYLFLVGTTIAIYFERIRPLLEGQGHWWLSLYVLGNLINLMSFKEWEVATYIQNAPGIINNALLGVTTISLAYTAPSLATRILRGNDISYGMYVYHMPVVNLLFHFGLTGKTNHLLAACALTIVIATISWRQIERKFIQLKPAFRPPRVGATE